MIYFMYFSIIGHRIQKDAFDATSQRPTEDINDVEKKSALQPKHILYIDQTITLRN